MFLERERGGGGERRLRELTRYNQLNEPFQRLLEPDHGTPTRGAELS